MLVLLFTDSVGTLFVTLSVLFGVIASASIIWITVEQTLDEYFIAGLIMGPMMFGCWPLVPLMIIVSFVLIAMAVVPILLYKLQRRLRSSRLEPATA